jgi:cell division protein FtsI/penicillin-binding protein 2
MRTRTFLLLSLILLLSACKPVPEPAASPSSTPAAPTPEPSLTPTPTRTPEPPKPEDAAAAFLSAWKAENITGMYNLLTAASQAAISLDDFTAHFRDIAIEAALKGIDTEILGVDNGAQEAKVRYRVTLHSNLVPDVVDETGMTLQLENGQWRVVWEDTIVLSYLSGPNYLSMNRDDYTPPRGLILDRQGTVMAGEEEAYSVGLNMNAYDPAFSEDYITTLARLTGTPAETIQERLDDAMANATPYLAFGEYTHKKGNSWSGLLSRFPAFSWNIYHSRFYYGLPSSGAAPHVIGYVGPIDAAQLDAYRRLGYRKDELIGQSGLEQWAERQLLGVRGGALYVRDGNNRVIQTLAEATAVPSQNITTTLDMNFQTRVQQAMSGLPGAAVVLERDSGRVLAMVSSPTFDPNAFSPANLNSYTELSSLNDPLRPLYNRAAQGQYPLGSVFKIIDTAAVLESGLLTPESTYECGYAFTDVPGVTKYDWTWDHFQEDGETLPSGLLTLPQGLIRSCNPWFYHIGQVLYEAGKPNAISDMARAFGLGKLTGIQGVSELPGNVPDPTSIEDALELAIGQSTLQVTPLQVASFVAAVGNGGTLYTPQVIEQIGPESGPPSYVFTPQVRGTLPVSEENLAVIQGAMRGVIISSKPRGTAYQVFNGMRIPIYGKTGTAQTGVTPHAWFVTYTDINNPKLPDIAIAVIVENGGEGSEVAAPIARRIIELYFNGRPGKLYPWESGYGILKTPEPPPAEEATPEP